MYVNMQSTGGFMGEGLACMRTASKRGIDRDPVLWCAAEVVRGGVGGVKLYWYGTSDIRTTSRAEKFLVVTLLDEGCICWSGCLRRKEIMSLNFRRVCSSHGACS